MSYEKEDGSIMATTATKETKTGKFTKGRVSADRLLGKRASVGAVEFENLEESMEKDAAFWGSLLNKATTAMGPVMTNGFKRGIGMGLAGAALGAAGMVGSAAVNRFIDQPKYEQALQQAIMLSPALKRYDINMLREYMSMIIKASPTVASDPRLLANYLESLLDAEGHLNLGTFKELASLENTVLTNNKMRNPLVGDFGSGVAKGVGKSVGEIAQNIFK